MKVADIPRKTCKQTMRNSIELPHTTFTHRKIFRPITFCYPHATFLSALFIPISLTSSFSLDIFHYLPSNHTNQFACIQHINRCPFCPIPISSILSSSSLIQFIYNLLILPTSSALHPTFPLLFAPYFLIFTFIFLCYYFLIIFNVYF